MKNGLILYFTLGFCLILTLPGRAQDIKREVVMTGDALEKKGTYFCTETTTMTYRNEHLEKSVTKYSTKDSKIIAELVSDFSKSDLLPDTQFLDHRDQYEYSLKLIKTENVVELSTKESAKSDLKKTTLKFKESMMLFQGALNYIKQNILKLQAKESLTADLVLPSRHDTISVIIEPIEEISQKEKIKVKIKTKSVFLRMLIPETILELERKSGRILQFEGVHSLLDEKDHQVPIVIKYNY